jgi:hypothetical protein
VHASTTRDIDANAALSASVAAFSTSVFTLAN